MSTPSNSSDSIPQKDKEKRQFYIKWFLLIITCILAFIGAINSTNTSATSKTETQLALLRNISHIVQQINN